MPHVTSPDGTTIAYDSSGKGRAVILVDGAIGHRAYLGGRPLAAELSWDFRVIAYDRRGRGESTDTLPYAVEREIEDIAALIDEVGAPVCLFGASSGSVLALRAAARLGNRVAKLALFEPPLSTDDESVREFAGYTRQTADLLAAGKRDEVVTLFLADMMPADMIDELRQSPDWPVMEAVAPTIAYDNAVLGDSSVPVAEASAVTAPTLLLDGDASMDFLREAVAALARAMPRAHRTTLAGQDHRAAPEALTAILVTFFKS